jgi:hypothetical protein
MGFSLVAISMGRCIAHNRIVCNRKDEALVSHLIVHNLLGYPRATRIAATVHGVVFDFFDAALADPRMSKRFQMDEKVL